MCAGGVLMVCVVCADSVCRVYDGYARSVLSACIWCVVGVLRLCVWVCGLCVYGVCSSC